MRNLFKGIVLLAGVILFVPIYLTNPQITISSLTTYYAAAFVFVTITLFLIDRPSEPKLTKAVPFITPNIVQEFRFQVGKDPPKVVKVNIVQATVVNDSLTPVEDPHLDFWLLSPATTRTPHFAKTAFLDR